MKKKKKNKKKKRFYFMIFLVEHTESVDGELAGNYESNNEFNSLV